MAKQRGGSPFTDSWFELPFWILFFLLVVSITLLWNYGIFTKSVPVAIAKPVIPGQAKHAPTFTIDKAYMEGLDSTYIFHSFFTVHNWTHKYELYARFVTDLNQATTFEKVTDPHHSFTYKIKSTKVPSTAYVEAYISLNDIPIGPTQRLDLDMSTQPASQSSSESSGLHPFVSSGPSKKGYTSPSLVGTQ